MAFDRRTPLSSTSPPSANGTRLKPSTPSAGSRPANPLTIVVPIRNGTQPQRNPSTPLAIYAGRNSGRYWVAGGGLIGSDTAGLVLEVGGRIPRVLPRP